MQKEKIALRLDDVFASTKQFEIYGRDYLKFGSKHLPIAAISNFLFLKFLPGLRRRLPYNELSVEKWCKIFEILRNNNARMTLGITSMWAEANNTLTPFFEKFPAEAAILRNAQKSGLIEIANHGLTHCVVGKHIPRLFSSNRNFHREFWPWVATETHKEHIEKSQKILSDYFGTNIVTFIPPGNVWTQDTEKAAFNSGIKYISSYEAKCPTGKISSGLLYISKVIAIHDRDIVLNGLEWFESLLMKNSGKEITTIKDVGYYLGQ